MVHHPHWQGPEPGTLMSIAASKHISTGQFTNGIALLKTAMHKVEAKDVVLNSFVV